MARVSEIYQDGIKTNLATFQQDIPTYDEWHKSHLQAFRYVCIVDNNIVGWLQRKNSQGSQWIVA